jgi:hypothetical protein
VDTVFKHPAFDLKKKFNQTLQERYDTSIERVVTLYDMAMNKGWLLNEIEMIGPLVHVLV